MRASAARSSALRRAPTQSLGCDIVFVAKYPGLEKVTQEVASWDRTPAYNKMQSIIQGNPVIAGNNEMAVGAISALKEANKLGSFVGSPDSVEAIRTGKMAYSALQPVAVFSREAVIQAFHYIKNGTPMVANEEQLFDCLLITPDTIGDYSAPFTLSN